MELRRTPARRSGLVALAVLLVFGASACSGGSGLVGTAPAATVNGTDISQAEVTGLAEANLAFYKQAKKLGQDQSGQMAAYAEQLAPKSEGTMTMDGAVEALDALIRREVMRGELARRDALPTKEEKAAARTALEESVGGKAELAKFDKDFITFSVESKALDTAFRQLMAADADKDNVALTPEEQEAQMRTLFEQAAPTLPLCLNGIQVATEAEAEAARARVEGGEDFGAVAQDLAPEGTEVAEGGFVACISFEDAQTSLGQDLSAAKAGDLVGPVALGDPQGGATVYGVFQVDGTDGPTYEQLLPQLQQAVPLEPPATVPENIEATAVSAAVQALYPKADVTVNPQFGRWSSARGAIVPPAVPGATTTLPVAAVAGS